MTGSKIYPCLWFDKDAEQAATLYASLLPDSRVDNVWRAPAETPSGPAGTVLLVNLTLAGQKFQLLAGGSQGFKPGPCGWLKDRWGVSWQIVPRRLNELTSDPDPERTRRAMEAMLTMGTIDIAELERAADAA